MYSRSIDPGSDFDHPQPPPSQEWATNAAPDALELWVERWAAGREFDRNEIDCSTAVMLKILDGKCKMPTHEKHIMARLYRAVKGRPYQHLGAEYHRLIRDASQHRNTEMVETIYELRVLAETQISRPVMKRFKSRLRQEGLLPSKSGGNIDD